MASVIRCGGTRDAAFVPATRTKQGATMKATLAPGLSAERSYPVDRDRTIAFMGEKARVYATPMLVRDVEVTCRDLLLEHLDPGEDSVGTRVEIDHLAATLLGMTATISVRVAEVKGRAVTFEVSGSDGVDTICRGRHARFVVSVADTEKRLAGKAAKAGLG
jgi:predicted thioesterase